MIPEIGFALLVLALGLSVLQAWPSHKSTGPVVVAVLVSVFTSFGCLLYAHITSDFSVMNVYEHSHSIKPLIYKISGTWGNHEGSMLLLVLVLAVYNAVFFRLSRSDEGLKNKVISIQGVIISCFLAFIVFTSSPFERVFPVPEDGRGLNPLLQDMGLAIHPPILYAGYVGFSLAFSFAVAGLLTGEINRKWAALLKGWVLASWAFLTLGIGLGSWWAYRELGWGGYWFWDPVENVSLMPWLIGTALLHCLLILEKREVLKSWAVLMALMAFSLSLIGIFLVRSGVLTSVHSFASAPERGVFILAFLTLVAGGAFTLFTLRAHTLKPQDSFAVVSKETTILINNLLLVIACATVLLGTLYPLILEVLGDASVSVGAPYFNSTVMPFAVPLLLLAGIGPMFKWGKDRLTLRPLIVLPAVIAICITVVLLVIWGAAPLLLVSAIAFSGWLISSTLALWVKHSKRFTQTLSLSFYGMMMAHIGIAVLALGIAVSSGWQSEKEFVIHHKESVNAGGYTVTLEGMFIGTGVNYLMRQGEFRISDEDGGTVAVLKPEVRYYPVEDTNTTEASIYYSLLSNLYIAMGDTDGGGGYAIRIYYKPCINLIWGGCVLMAMGGLLPLLQRKYKRAKV